MYLPVFQPVSLLVVLIADPNMNLLVFLPAVLPAVLPSVLPVAPHDVLPHLVATAFGPPTSLPLLPVSGRGVVVLAVKTLPEVINGLRVWLMGILATVATLFLVIAGLRYVTAASDPASVEAAKGSFKAALVGYALAVLAPVILQVLQGILGA